MAARSLEQLQKQYSRSAPAGGMRRGPGGPGRGPGPGRRLTGKPKNARATITRLLQYVSRYKLSLLLVLCCMLVRWLSWVL